MNKNTSRITPGQPRHPGLDFTPILVTGEGAIGIDDEEFAAHTTDEKSVPPHEISGSAGFPHGNGD